MKYVVVEHSCNFSVFSTFQCGETRTAVGDEGADLRVNGDDLTISVSSSVSFVRVCDILFCFTNLFLQWTLGGYCFSSSMSACAHFPSFCYVLC